MRITKLFITLVAPFICLALSQLTLLGGSYQGNGYIGDDGTHSYFTEAEIDYSKNEITVDNKSNFVISEATFSVEGATPAVLKNIPANSNASITSDNGIPGDAKFTVSINMADFKKPIPFTFNKNFHNTNIVMGTPEAASKTIGTLFYDVVITLSSDLVRISEDFDGYQWSSNYIIGVKITPRDIAK